MGIMALFRAGTTLLIIGVVGGSALSEDHANTHLGTSGECFEHAETKCLWFMSEQTIVENTDTLGVVDADGHLPLRNRPFVEPQRRRHLNENSPSVQLTVNTSSLQRSGDFVSVHWAGVSKPSVYDWIGVYSPEDSEDRDFLSYVNVTSASTWSAGEGR
eukprot:1188999-Prorocentrum_minimum.AAC.2